MPKMSGFTSTSSSIPFLGRDLSGKLHSRRLLLHVPLHKLPSIVTTSSASTQTQSAPYAAASGFNANVVMVLSVLLCALICSLGLRSIIKCSLRCSSLLATRSNNSSENVSRAANTSKGIKRKALKAFTTVNYSPDLRLPGLAAECVICLSEFATGERVRLLPKCNHGFHLRCIDKWLTSHSSCPTCRQNLLETCQKIAGCNQPSSSQLPQPPSSSPSPRETPINLMPLQREDLERDYRGNSLS